jgi:hypothetical protein
MASGHSNSDLSRILHDPEFVHPSCNDRSCRWGTTSGFFTKPKALRLARDHAAMTGHTVMLSISHWQLVHPKEA